MNDLVLKEKVVTLDSREVAEMVGKQHAHLLRDIETYISYISENPKLDSQNFFIESEYKSEGNNKSYKCYDITKKGCEFIAHKLTGQKGAIFTATYINRFHEMENVLQKPKALSPMDQLRLQYEVLDDHDERLTLLENTMTIDYGQQQTLQNIARKKAIEAIGGKEKPSYKDNSLRNKVFSAVWKDFKDYFEINSYKNTSRKDFEKAKQYLQGWQVQGKLLREIEDCNSQIRFQEVC